MLNDFVSIFLGCFNYFFPPEQFEGDYTFLSAVLAVVVMCLLLACVCGTVLILVHGCIRICCNSFRGSR